MFRFQAEAAVARSGSDDDLRRRLLAAVLGLAILVAAFAGGMLAGRGDAPDRGGLADVAAELVAAGG
ncbi:hypothetical protein GCM10011505_40090 [Tistrella bauzanensis]|uniref:Uncharacterized protein n=1 Tax=Tistrella bauzanensis TaxID=657419 RepID=A0ABQ1J0Y1_9PROT|nr:hypothetical protein [Tistrella bauzanensis]GGB55065.1 hypothetical protein GCM10011505_40090 [Tistrella bauzanensis]